MAQVTTAQEGQRPARLGPRRPARLQICLSDEERVSLDAHACAGGYDSVAAYVRARTLDQQTGPQPAVSSSPQGPGDELYAAV